MQPIVVPLDASARPVRDSAPYDAVDAYIEQYMRRLNIPAIALTIVPKAAGVKKPDGGHQPFGRGGRP